MVTPLLLFTALLRVSETVKEAEEHYEPHMPRRVKKFSEPPMLPDLVQIRPPQTADCGASSPGPVSPEPALLSSSLQLRLRHIQHVKRLSRREGTVTPPVRRAAATPSRRVSAPARPSALAARLRKISVTDTLRQVGQDLRRIADHLQLSRLVVSGPGAAGVHTGFPNGRGHDPQGHDPQGL